MAEENKEIVIVDDKTIQEKIYFIRGQKVMLDIDLAEIYGYATKNFNRQVKNNIKKFEGEDFMFQLTSEEIFELSRCKNFTLNRGIGRGNNIKYNPYAFTEQGIYMLMTVLRGELAIRQSKALIRMFKQMKDFIIENQDFIGLKELVQIAIQTNRNINDIAKINDKINTLATKEDLKKVMDNFIDPDTYKHFLLMNGCRTSFYMLLITLINFKIKNRFFKAAMNEAMGTKYMKPKKEIIHLYETWAKGGAGLIITGNVMVDPNALAEPGNIVFD